MRHVYIRILLGAIFLICMIACFIKKDIPLALLYMSLGGIFLFYAYRYWKKKINDSFCL